MYIYSICGKLQKGAEYPMVILWVCYGYPVGRDRIWTKNTPRPP